MILRVVESILEEIAMQNPFTSERTMRIWSVMSKTEAKRHQIWEKWAAREQKRAQEDPEGAQREPKQAEMNRKEARKERWRGRSSPKESPREPKDEKVESKETQNGHQMTLKSDTLRNFLCSTNHMFSSSKTNDFESRGVDLVTKSDTESMYKQKDHANLIGNI